MRRRNVLDDILGENIVQKTNRVMQEEKNNNPPANNVNVEAIADFVNSKTQQAETPQPTQPTQPIKTQQVEKTTTPTDNSAFVEKMTTKNVFAEKNKDVIAPKSTPEQQGFNIPEPKREEFNTYEKQINLLTLPETEEERLAREKKERSSKNLSALFDGLTALSNIYHTTQYAPPQTLTSGTEKMTQKYDKLRENADKIKKEYQNAILKLRQLDDADYQNAWNRWFALRKQYENGEISKQKMQQDWEQFQIQLGEKQKDREQKDRHHKEKMDLEKEEGKKNRAVQREKNGEKGKTKQTFIVRNQPRQTNAGYVYELSLPLNDNEYNYLTNLLEENVKSTKNKNSVANQALEELNAIRKQGGEEESSPKNKALKEWFHKYFDLSKDVLDYIDRRSIKSDDVYEYEELEA